MAVIIRYDDNITPTLVEDDAVPPYLGIAILRVQATTVGGKWLERIQRHFTNLPDVFLGDESRTWYGDHAQFIVEHLLALYNLYHSFWEADDAADAKRAG